MQVKTRVGGRIPAANPGSLVALSLDDHNVQPATDRAQACPLRAAICSLPRGVCDLSTWKSGYHTRLISPPPLGDAISSVPGDQPGRGSSTGEDRAYTGRKISALRCRVGPRVAGVRHYDGGISAAAAVGSSQPVAHTAGLQQKLRQPSVRCWMRRLLRMPAVPEYQKAGSYCTATCVPMLRHRLTWTVSQITLSPPCRTVSSPCHTLSA